MWMRNNDYWLFFTELLVATTGDAKRLSSCAIQSMHPYYLHLMHYYDQGTIADAPWVFIEPNVRGTNNVVTRLPLVMTSFFELFKTCL